MAPIILMRMEKGCRLVAGERRRACRELGLPAIPARILDMEGNREEILCAEPISVMRHNINGSIFRLTD